ncbi:dihydrofolate reductase [Paenibacillus sp. KN14-4R]|uniref:dihydrofolate reductase n=1 Tax=Paenibacillus sp. KN14-4R TaxID=3445773 RepID=UPI003FA03C26
MNVKISLIAAMDNNRVIGYKNDMPWRLPKEWEYVKKTTMGRPLIMGRKNHESIGRALPGRRNLILTRDLAYTAKGCEIVHTVEDVFTSCAQEEEIFIFGGEQIYRLFLPYVTKMYLTRIDHEFEGDTYFPEINEAEWNEVSVVQGVTDEQNPYRYRYHVYERRS